MITKRTKIIGLVAVLVVLVVLLGILFSPRDKATEQGIIPTPTTGYSIPSPFPARMSKYEEFVKGDKTEVCVFAANVEESITTGTIYAAYGKIRADFIVTTPSGTFQQFFLVDSLMGYLWTNLDRNGFKFPLVESDAADIQDTLGPGKPYNITCSNWEPNMNVFRIPADIVFTEIIEPPEFP